MQLSIIIINYNTFTLTSNCIASIYEKLTGVVFEIILVDNASPNENPDTFKEHFPDIQLVKSTTNLGFAGGNNLGLQYASGEYILLLNSDTELINNAPLICLKYLQQHPKTGLVTCQLQYPDGRLQYNCRRFRTIWWEINEIIPFFRFYSKEKQGTIMLHRYFNHTTPVNCDWVWGAFMLFPKTIIEKLPGKKLAEDFFMYCEDVLWCWQIKKAGYTIHFLSDAKVMHINKGSADKNRLLQVRKTIIKNHARFMKKFYPDIRWYLFAAIYYTKQYAALWLGKKGE